MTAGLVAEAEALMRRAEDARARGWTDIAERLTDIARMCATAASYSESPGGDG